MNRYSLFLLSSLCLYVSVVSSTAAPPTLTYLYPAGAKSGTTVEVTAAGTLDASTEVRGFGGLGMSVEVSKEKGKLKIRTPNIPGTYWLRAYNAEGASTLRPFIVGTLTEVMEKEPNDDFKKPHVL